MGKRTRSGKVEYLVKWRGYDICDNTWEPQANLSDSALRVAQKFSRKKKEEREISEREVRRYGGEEGRTYSASFSISYFHH